jgi:hypothetical protein
MYGISRRSIHRYITQGLLPAYRVGPRKNIRLDADEVERVMLANPVVGPTTKQKEAAPGKEAAPKGRDQQHNQGTHSGQARYALREAFRHPEDQALRAVSCGCIPQSYTEPAQFAATKHGAHSMRNEHQQLPRPGGMTRLDPVR